VNSFPGIKEEIKLITLDSGHLHAALVQKNRYKEVSPDVFVYAPKGVDLEQHLNRIEGYKTRAVNPIPALFGKLQTGSAEHPSVEKVSVHYFY